MTPSAEPAEPEKPEQNAWMALMSHEERDDGPTAGATAPARLVVDEATIGYDRTVISERLSVEIPDGSFTAIIGPNGCGKSTLLRALARVLAPAAGRVLLDGKAISAYRSKDIARSAGAAAAGLPRAGRDQGRGPRRPWPCPPPGPCPALAPPRRGGRGGGDAGDPADRAFRASGGRAVGWAAAARVGGDAAGPADADPAAGRADHVPGHRPPVRADGAVPYLPRPGQDDRGGAPRPEPGRPLRRSSRRDARRRRRHHGQPG